MAKIKSKDHKDATPNTTFFSPKKELGGLLFQGGKNKNT